MFGQFNLLCPVAVITGGLIFAMYGASSPGGAIVFAILYGFFSGGCEWLRFSAQQMVANGPCARARSAVVSLVPPTIAVLSRDVNEIGCAASSAACIPPDFWLTPICLCSFRVGMGYFLTSFAILTGTPISGALFKDGVWSKPIAFSGVRGHAVSIRLISD